MVELHVEVVNYALRDIDPERMRLHLCWGNVEGPHHHDVPLREIVDTVLGARPNGLSFEGREPPPRPRVEGLGGRCPAGWQGADPRGAGHHYQLH